MSDAFQAGRSRPSLPAIVGGTALALTMIAGAILALTSARVASLYLADLTAAAANPSRVAGVICIAIVAILLARLTSLSDATKKVAYLATVFAAVVGLVSFYVPSELECDGNFTTQGGLMRKRQQLILAWAVCLEERTEEACQDGEYSDNAEVLRRLSRIEQQIAALLEREDAACR